MEKIKNILKFIIVLCLIILCFVLFMVFYKNSSIEKTTNVKELAEYGENQFLENDFNLYLEDLRNKGIKDLTAEVDFKYTEKNNFNREKKILYINCYLNFYSDEIDKFFTTNFGEEKCKKLLKIMYNMLEVMTKEYTYSTEQGEKVIINISYDGEFEILSQKGYSYKIIAKDYSSYADLDINDELVYLEEKLILEEKSYSSLTNDDKEQIIDYIYGRYKYYDEKEGRDTGNKYTETIWQETMDAYGLTYEEVDRIWYRLD